MMTLDRPTTATVVTSDPRMIRRACNAYADRDEPLMFDTETTGLDPRTNKLVMMQFHQPSSPTTLIVDCRTGEWRGAHGALQAVFEQRLVVGHNLKFDAEFLLAAGLHLSQVFDTMLAEQLLSCGQGWDVSLAATLKRHFGRELDKMQRSWFYQPAPLHERPDEWNAPFPEEEVTYAALDVTCLPELYETQQRLLTSTKLWQVANIEMRVLPAYAGMEMRGIHIEQVGWRAFIAEQEQIAREATDKALNVLGPIIMRERIAEYDAALDEYTAGREGLKFEEMRLKRNWEVQPHGLGWGEYKKQGLLAYREQNVVPAKPKLDTEPPNIGSQKQLIGALETLGIEVPMRPDKTGKRVKTVDSDSLEKLAPAHPFLQDVLDARKASKFVDAFGEKLLGFVDKGGRIHPDFHQIGAGTGRSSCSNPNFQQVPARGDGKRLRECVTASAGHKLVVADFSNMELRIIADLSGDAHMLEMFASGEDLHSYTARLMFNLEADVDPKATVWRNGLTYRQAAKIVNFLIPYGGSAYALAMQNSLPLKDAEELVNKWFGLFPGVQAWMKSLEKAVHRDLQSVTRSGRIRRFNEPREPERIKDMALFMQAKTLYIRAWKSIEKQARNSPVQGLGADITKLAVALFHENWREVGGLIAVVHDELVVETAEALAPLAATTLAMAMDSAAHAFLHQVDLPYPEPTISDHWTHE